MGGQDPVVGWQARGLRPGLRGYGRCQEDRNVRISERQDQQEDCDCRLWTAVLSYSNPIRESPIQQFLIYYNLSFFLQCLYISALINICFFPARLKFVSINEH